MTGEGTGASGIQGHDRVRIYCDALSFIYEELSALYLFLSFLLPGSKKNELAGKKLTAYRG